MTARDQVVQGGRELDQLLQTLPGKMQKNINRGGLRAGAVVALDAVKSRIPVDQGDLRDSARITTRAKGATVSASVKVGNAKAYYARFVEFGTRPHLVQVSAQDRGINRRTGKQISVTTVNRQRTLNIGGVLVGPSVQHPGAKPHPFMRPAIDAVFPEVIKAVTDKIRQRLTKEGLIVPEALPPELPE
jgi:HK97 gp10 family phage protein